MKTYFKVFAIWLLSFFPSKTKGKIKTFIKNTLFLGSRLNTISFVYNLVVKRIESTGVLNIGWHGNSKIKINDRFATVSFSTTKLFLLSERFYNLATELIMSRYYQGLSDRRMFDSSDLFASFVDESFDQTQKEVPRKFVEKSYSIITPYYQHWDFFKKCISSVESLILASASTTRVEWIILNDDVTLDDSKLESLIPSTIRHLVHVHGDKVNRGITKRLNQGIESSKNNWILFLDCDDLISANALDILSHYIDRFPGCRYLSSGITDIDEKGKVLRFRKHQFSPTKIFTAGMICGHLKAVRKDVFQEIGLLDERYEGCQDYEFALRYSRNEKIFLIPEYLYSYRWHSRSQSVGSISRQNLMTSLLKREFILTTFFNTPFDRSYDKSCALGDLARGACVIEAMDGSERSVTDSIKSVILNDNSFYLLFVGFSRELQEKILSGFSGKLHRYFFVSCREEAFRFALQNLKQDGYVFFIREGDILYPYFSEIVSKHFLMSKADVVCFMSSSKEKNVPDKQLLPFVGLLSNYEVNLSNLCFRTNSIKEFYSGSSDGDLLGNILKGELIITYCFQSLLLSSPSKSQEIEKNVILEKLTDFFIAEQLLTFPFHLRGGVSSAEHLILKDISSKLLNKIKSL